MKTLQPLPLGIQSFEKIISEKYLYIDKTKYIYNLIKSGPYYFLSRPRRFGKSLLVSTLKELFSGNKMLFDGLWITQNTNHDWQKYPVIDLDFSQIPHHNAQQLYKALNDRLIEIAKEQNIVIELKDSPDETLRFLIKEMAKHNRVVILIDEYDKPILDHISNLEEAKAQREILRSFYTVIKSMDHYLKFVLLTGVTKFSKASIFSGLNNLNDISMDPISANLLGYTDIEIDHYLGPHIDLFAQKNNLPAFYIREQMRTWYNGYRFSIEPDKVYNPWSTLYCLHKKQFQNYWFESGTPSFLIHLIKKQPDALHNLNELEISPKILSSFEIEAIDLITVLFQTGYLTITDYNQIENTYKLDYPNYETRESFKEYLLSGLTHIEVGPLERLINQLKAALRENNLEIFCKHLQTLFAHIPYQLHIQHEHYYHSLFQLVGTMLGADTQSEVSTDKGRIDMVINSPHRINIFEIKFNKQPGKGMEQVEERRYYEKFRAYGKPIILVEVLFNRTKDDFTIECISKNY